MALFLFLKQIVDMLYQYRILDYIMVIWVVLLLLYQVALVRPDIRKSVTWTDTIVVLLSLLLLITFIRSQSGYQIYFKVMSAFLMYFVGRIYYDRIREYETDISYFKNLKNAILSDNVNVLKIETDKMKDNIKMNQTKLKNL